MYNHRIEAMERAPSQSTAGSADFAELFGDATRTAISRAIAPAVSAGPASPAASTVPAAQTSLGQPDVQGWLNSYYTEHGNSGAATTSYQPAQGAANNFPTGSVFGPDAIFAQAFANQAGNAFATMTGNSAEQFTSQLPGTPSEASQQEFDRRLALENLGRLQSGQPIDTTAYWSDPGSITTGGVTYTAQELGYAGPAQSSGPQPIYISQANQIQGTDKFSVPGYQGTVTGIEPGRYYTLQQLEHAGLTAGQPDGQFHPGSWSTTQTAG
jgi:hypothetical protein